MPVCHKCKYAADIARLRQICCKCQGACENFGRDVHIDAAPDPNLVLAHADKDRIRVNREATVTRVQGVDDDTAELLARVIAEFSALSDLEAPIVARRLRGQENWQIAAEMKINKATVWVRWENLKKKNPIWAALDNGLIGKRAGGRPKRTNPEMPPISLTQMALFTLPEVPGLTADEEKEGGLADEA